MTALILAGGKPVTVPPIPSDWSGWLVIIIVLGVALWWVLGVLGLRK